MRRRRGRGKGKSRIMERKRGWSRDGEWECDAREGSLLFAFDDGVLSS